MIYWLGLVFLIVGLWALSKQRIPLGYTLIGLALGIAITGQWMSPLEEGP